MSSSSTSNVTMVQNQLMKDDSGEEGRYTGPCISLEEQGGGGGGFAAAAAAAVTVVPHGSDGEMKYPNGRIYSGEWMFGKWHGRGHATFPNGDSYQGEYRCDERHGRGLYKWNDGRTYDGMFYKDLRHGQGLYKWPQDGTIYEGTFERGQRQGQGTYIFNGGKYVGDFEKGLYHGYGECTWEDGRTYKGEWVDGMAHGMGIETDSSGRIFHQGAWHEDEPVLSKNKNKRSTTSHGPPASPDLQGRAVSQTLQQASASSLPTALNGGGIDHTSTDQGSSSSLSSTFGSFTRMFQKQESSDAMQIQKPSSTASPTMPPQPTFGTSSPFDAIGRILGGGVPAAPPLEAASPPPQEEAKMEPVVNKVLKDSRGREGTFRGMVLRGLPHGVGHMVYSKSATCHVNTYQGFWDYGDWKQGRVDYCNGDIYHGDFSSHNLRSGSGHYKWVDGRQYEGEWKDDNRHGHGKFQYPNGDTFEGQFVTGQRQGHGRYEFHDGSLFEGGFSKGQFHGPGCKYVHRDGRVFMGDFADGERTGYGKEVYPNGSLRYEGEWANDDPLQPNKIQPAPPGFVMLGDEDMEDTSNNAQSSNNVISKPRPVSAIFQETKDCTTVVEEDIKDGQGNPGTFTGLVLKGLPHGVGRMVYASEIREGFWKHGYLEGHARAFFANGDFYEGMFAKSQREGKGVYKWKDGRVFEGDYVDDQRHGQGRFVYPTGDEYCGNYDSGMRSGKGKFTFSDGSSYSGEWLNSLYHGYGELLEVNGDYYKGEWKESKKHGKGELYKGNVLKKGEWEENQLVKETEVPDTPISTEAKPSEKSVKEGCPKAPKQSFRWGSMDFENTRWKPVSTGPEESDDGEDFDKATPTEGVTSQDQPVSEAHEGNVQAPQQQPNGEMAEDGVDPALSDTKEHQDDSNDEPQDGEEPPALKDEPLCEPKEDVLQEESLGEASTSEPEGVTRRDESHDKLPTGEAESVKRTDECDDECPTGKRETADRTESKEDTEWLKVADS